MKVLKSFPSIDNLSEFYKELINITLDYAYIKKSLASLKWCVEKNKEFLKTYKNKIKLATEIERINQYRKEFYGRVASTLKQINKHLEYLEFSRRTMLDYPSIKTSLTTIAIIGFPNVGKSTLLSKLTTAKPKIASYAFTTTGINIGYAEINSNKIQFLDTPGTLNRFERQNTVERIATLAIKYIADGMIYVFDLTEASSPLEDQVKLYENLKKSRKPIIIFLSKTDAADKEKIEKFKGKYGAVANTEELKERLKDIKVL
jgi:nucleolar GTP-binding protein